MAKWIKPFGILFILITFLVLIITGCDTSPKMTVSTATQATRDPVLESTLVSQLTTMNPAAVPVYQEATTDLDAGKLATAKSLYEKVLELAPNFSTAYRRIGSIYLDNNDFDSAIEQLRKAIAIEPNPYNQSALALALLSKKTPRDNQESFNLASEAAKTLPNDESIVLTWLLSSAKMNDEKNVREADGQLLQINPTDPYAQYFAGLISANDGKWEEAKKELLYSQQLGMSEEDVKSVMDKGVSRNALLSELLRWGLIALGCWMLGLALLYLIGMALSRATLNALNASQPVGSTQIKPKEHRIRSIYRAVVRLLSLYYYISIPFVILLLFLFVGGIFYLFMVMGTVPIYWSFVLAVMLIGSLIAIVRTIFSRSREVPPGRPLLRNEAPELWTLVETVARKLTIRPVDTIYLTPTTEIGVFEKGSILKKMRGTGKRNLILGMGAISGLTQGQFTAILAHEYGHFSNRDTAGGNLAHQVYASLQQMAKRLVKSKANQIYNPAWLFVLLYQNIYLRVTQGASRLQEVLADRYAATTFGSSNFIEGLKNVVRQSVVFAMSANHEIQVSLEENRPIINLYELPISEEIVGELEKKVAEAMTRPTSKFDSHPAPQERIALIERLQLPYLPMEENSQPVLRLLPNPEGLEREMTAEITKTLRK